MSKEQQSQQKQNKPKRPSPLPETTVAPQIPLQPGLQNPARLDGLPNHATSRGVRQATVLQMQQRQGNIYIQRLLSEQSPQLVNPTPQQPRTLAATPASGLSPLPQNVRDDHAARIIANDFSGALQAVTQHMESQGEIDPSLIGTPTATQTGATVCRNNATTYIADPTIGHSAFTTKCDCSGPTGNQGINVRIQVGYDAIRRIETLHSTLLHEFRHVRQEHEACNQTSRQTQFAGVVTDCNSPEEMDAYLAEIEGGYDPQSIRAAWVRVYTNWLWLAPEQQAVFMSRQISARQKVDGLFPFVNWVSDPRVIRYSRWCQQLDSQAGSNTAGSCDSPLAPLNGPGPNPGLPIPEPAPPKGDFPIPESEGDRRYA